MTSLEQIVGWLLAYKYFVLFPAVVIEGPIVTIIVGFLVSLQQIDLFIAYFIIVIADVAGDCIYYAIGRWGKENFIKRWGHYVGITVERVKRIEDHFAKHSGKTLIVGKLTHAIGVVFLLAAGIAKMPFQKFLLFNFIPSLPKSLILLFIGYYFGQAYVQINRYLNYTALAMVGAAVLLIIFYSILKKIGKKYE